MRGDGMLNILLVLPTGGLCHVLINACTGHREDLGAVDSPEAWTEKAWKIVTCSRGHHIDDQGVEEIKQSLLAATF